MTEFKPPMLLSEITGYRSMIEAEAYVFVQPKLDGWRCMANTRTRKIYTRSGREIKTLPHINDALPIDGPEWLDGELYCHGHSVDEIQSMIKRGDTRIEFHVFDCVRNDNFYLRKIAIHHLLVIDISSPIKYVSTAMVSPNEIPIWFSSYLSHGYEGLVIRMDGHGYEHGRSNKIFKMKPGTEVM